MFKSVTRNQAFARHVKNYYQLYLFVLPAFLVILFFHYFPMYGVQLAFKKYDSAKGLLGGDFVGLQYFQKFIKSYQFSDLMRNTFLLSLYTIAAGFPIPIVFSLIFNQIQNPRSKKMMQTISYMPHFVSVIVLVGMLLIFLSPSSGMAGHLYRLFGLEPVNLMGEESCFRTIYVISDIWQHAGWNSIIYVAALSAIDVQLYEAAKVDGANRWQQILHIDVPSLAPTIIILLILNAGNIMTVGFEKAFLMQNATNMGVSEVISTYVYKMGIISNQISYSSAIGLFNTLINFVFLLLVNLLARKYGDVSLW